MHIGIDASRVFVDQRTGTENYTFNLIRSIAKIDKKNTYTLYVRPTAKLASKGDPFLNRAKNFRIKIIPFPIFWTQLGLALECLVNPPDVLFIPAHTLPLLRRPGLKTLVTIHDLGSKFLPQYHQFPQKIYLNWSTIFAVKFATKIIAVSKSTKNDLIKKLKCPSEKIEVIYEAHNI